MKITEKGKNIARKAGSAALVTALIAVPAAAFAIKWPPNGQSFFGGENSNTAVESQAQEQGGLFGGIFGQSGSSSGSSNASSSGEVTESALSESSAAALTADEAAAETIVMSESNSSVKISEAGTYIITGSCSDGNIAVKKGTTGVVLILKDLDLTSTTGATLSLNKGTETKVVIEGTVKLTDAEDLANEEADDFDGAAIKAKSGSSTVITGTGTLYVNGQCKNGIKVSSLDETDAADGCSEAVFVIDGDLSIVISAANDGINSGTDLTIRSGNITVSAGDDGIKADNILTIGEEGTNGPTINVKKSAEAIEGTVVNICSGTIDVTASDDGINASLNDGSSLTPSINIMGGTVNISSGADALDSNGNINITGGLTTVVKAAAGGGDAGLDYDGGCYIADGCFVNPYGTTMDSGMGGQMGGFGGMNGQKGQMGGGFGGMRGQFGQDQQSGSSQAPSQEGTAPFGTDGTSGATPQMPQQGGFGQDGQAPDMGQMPQGGQGFGGCGGRGRQGQMNGQMPGMGCFPGQSGQLPDLSQTPGTDVQN